METDPRIRSKSIMSNFGIGKKIAFGLSLVVLLMVIVAGSGYWAVTVTNKTVQAILGGDSSLAVNSLLARVRILDLRRFEKDYELNIGDKKAQAEYFTKWSDSLDDLKGRLAELDKVSTSPQDKAVIQEMEN